MRLSLKDQISYHNARVLIGLQHQALSKIKDVRFFSEGYEFRINYQGGFSSYIAVDFRKIGGHKFNYFCGYGAYHCRDAKEAMEAVTNKINQLLKEMENHA